MNCTACGRAAQENDRFCAACGKSLQETRQNDSQSVPTKKSNKVAWFFIFLAVFIYAYSKFSTSFNPRLESSTPSDSTASEAIQNWHYDFGTDSMTGRNTKSASLYSVNDVEFGFPYEGPQRLLLLIRKNKNTDAIISVKKGQFVCDRLDDCSIRIRFEDGQPVKFRISEPTDHSSTARFIENASLLVSRLKKSKTMRLEATFFQEGTRHFDFRTEHFNW